MPNLQYLYIIADNIQEIPNSICNLEKLQGFDIITTTPVTYPEHISQNHIKKLKKNLQRYIGYRKLVIID